MIMEKKKGGWIRVMLKVALGCGIVGMAFLLIYMVFGVV